MNTSPRSKPQSHGEETQALGASLNPMEGRPKSQDQASSPFKPMEKRPKSQESSLKSMERHRSQEPGSSPWRDTGPRSQAQLHEERLDSKKPGSAYERRRFRRKDPMNELSRSEPE
ncbi:hypothetical protein N7524_006644 [Penicillium chrysogenum]|nr:hypothetical protein N7524_006644 [Penicillium chrysogenum]